MRTTERPDVVTARARAATPRGHPAECAHGYGDDFGDGVGDSSDNGSETGFGYDRLAGVYHALERLAFGGSLQRARLAHIDALSACRQVLTLGEGDGRFVTELARRQPRTRILAADASLGMIHKARANLPAGASVRMLHTDLRTLAPPPDAFDAVVGLFVFDQFERRTLETVLPALVRGLRPGGLWLHADFAVPGSGWRRWRSLAWLTLLYGAFGMVTDMEARRLVPVGPLLEQAGLERVRRTTWLHEMVEATLYRRPAR